MKFTTEVIDNNMVLVRYERWRREPHKSVIAGQSEYQWVCREAATAIRGEEVPGFFKMWWDEYMKANADMQFSHYGKRIGGFMGDGSER